MQGAEYSCKNFIYIKEGGNITEKCLCPPDIYKKAVITVKEKKMIKPEFSDKEDLLKDIIHRLDVIEQKLK